MEIAQAGDLVKENADEEIIDTGIREAERLNKKYGSNIFFFAYRKRIWSNSENSYMGWERKRGLLTELNSFLTNKKGRNTFIVNTLSEKRLRQWGRRTLSHAWK